jgi:hypothetical protein
MKEGGGRRKLFVNRRTAATRMSMEACLKSANASGGQNSAAAPATPFIFMTN